MKITYFGFDEAEYFQALQEMPAKWRRSAPAFAAVAGAYRDLRMLARFHFLRSEHKMAKHYLDQIMLLKKRHGLSHQLVTGQWVMS